MENMLILGGTGWLGREIAQAAFSAGIAVTCLARGDSGEVPSSVEFVQQDRLKPDAYQAVTRDWTYVVELCQNPELVEPALAALARYATHWTYVSSISVYVDNSTPGAGENAELVEIGTNPSSLPSYAQAKVLAEQASMSALGDKLLIVRPGLIVGPGDPSDRFGYWVSAFAHAKQSDGIVLSPTPEGRTVQVIEVADLASWIIAASRMRLVDIVDAVGDVVTWDEFLGTTRDVTGFSGQVLHAADEDLLAQGVGYWTGERSLPLWLPQGHTAMMDRGGQRFRNTEGKTRPLRETVDRVWADEQQRGVDRPRKAGLNAAQQDEIIAAILGKE